VTRLCEALGWTAENRPSRGADAVFRAASDEIVVTWLDGQLEPRRRRGGLVAAAVVVALLAAGVAVGIFSRTAAPTVTTGDDTPTTEVVPSSVAPGPPPCRVDGECAIPDRPVTMIVTEVPDGFTVPSPVAVNEDWRLFGPGIVLRGTGREAEIRIVTTEIDPAAPPGVITVPPNAVVGTRTARFLVQNNHGLVETGHGLLNVQFSTEIVVLLNGRLRLEVVGDNLSLEELLPLVQSMELR
jgi:hypothetical protein